MGTDAMSYRRVQVTWHDARGEPGWHQIDDLKPSLALIKTAGWIIERTPDVLMIATSLCDDNGAGDVTHIPAIWIDHIEDI